MKKCLILLFTAAFMAASVMPAMAEGREKIRRGILMKEYAGKEMFDKPWPVVSGPVTLRERFLEGGKMDVDRFINSGQGEALVNSYKLQIKYKMAWNRKSSSIGMTRALKKRTINADPRTRWFVLCSQRGTWRSTIRRNSHSSSICRTPTSSDCEGRGYVELAAQERLIVVIPTATDIEDISALYTRVVKMYPGGYQPFLYVRLLLYRLSHPGVCIPSP